MSGDLLPVEARSRSRANSAETRVVSYGNAFFNEALTCCRPRVLSIELDRF